MGHMVFTLRHFMAKISRFLLFKMFSLISAKLFGSGWENQNLLQQSWSFIIEMGNVCWVDALLLSVIILAYNVIKCDLCLTRLLLHFWIYFNCKSLRDIKNLITVSPDTA